MTSCTNTGSNLETTDTSQEVPSAIEAIEIEVEQEELIQAQTPTIPELVSGALRWDFALEFSGAAAVASRDGNRNVNPFLRGGVEIIEGRNGGNAAIFTGVHGGLYLGDNLINSDTYTIAFWAKPQFITEWTSMFFAGNTTSHLSITPRHGGGSTTAFLVPGHQWHFNPGIVEVNEWSHFAFTSNGSESKFYINAQLVDVVINPTDIFGTSTNNQFFLGVNPFDDPTFRGLIQDVYIFPERALDVFEIREISGIISRDLIIPGANTVFDDPDDPEFINTTIHDPSLTRARSNDGWFYAIGTDLGAARTRDFIQWESINYGLGNPQLGNPGERFSFFPIDNPDTNVETMEDQIRYIGAFHQANPANVIFWASEIINVDGRYFHYYSLAGGINEWNWAGRNRYMPQAGLGVAVADSIDGPWVTQGIFIRSGYSNRFHEGNRVVFNSPDGANMSMLDAYFDPRIHPNSIDSSPFICENGDLWLVYGSYGGGVFLLEMDRETGLPLPIEKSVINGENDGFGRLLIALTHHSGEGPHMIFSQTSGYYYLFLTHGWLASYGGYNVRMFRSENPYGPFEDARFSQMHVQDNPLAAGTAVRWLDVDGSEFHHSATGNKIIGGYHFVSADLENWRSTSYLSPGHGGLIYYEGRYLKIFHTRFEGRWEWHQVRVHEMLMNEFGWFVMAPLRFDGGGGARSFEVYDLVGDFKILNHGRRTNAEAVTSSIYRLGSDFTIINENKENVGTWELDGANTARFTLYDVTYSGFFLRQFDEASRTWVQTFTAMSYDYQTPIGVNSSAGVTIWGKGVTVGAAYFVLE